MGGRTHMSFGALSFVCLAGPVSAATGLLELGPLQLLGGIWIGAIAGLLPDIDEPNAKLGRGGWAPRKLGPLVKLFAVLVSFPFRILGYAIKGVLGHRGGTHSLAMSLFFTFCFAIPLTSLFGAAADWVIWTIWAGYLSHLLADMMNPSGVPLLWPLFSKHKTFHVLPKPLRIPTERPPNAREQMVNGAVVGIALLLGLIFCVLLPLSK